LSEQKQESVDCTLFHSLRSLSSLTLVFNHRFQAQVRSQNEDKRAFDPLTCPSFTLFYSLYSLSFTIFACCLCSLSSALFHALQSLSLLQSQVPRASAQSEQRQMPLTCLSCTRLAHSLPLSSQITGSKSKCGVRTKTKACLSARKISRI
jgi:hypothetical protein